MAGVAVREGEAEEVADSVKGATVGSGSDGVMALGGSGTSVGCVGSVVLVDSGLGSGTVVSTNGRSALGLVPDGRC